MKASNKILLTDTVGFIEGLPPWLVEAFKATLEEIYLADLVVLVVDASEPVPEIIRKLKASESVLAEYPVKVITALNKVDLLSGEELNRKMETLQSLTSTAVPISAKYGTNLNSLIEVMRSRI
jgi:GTP-binding protein HflX